MLKKQNTSSEMPIYFEKVGEIKNANADAQHHEDSNKIS